MSTLDKLLHHSNMLVLKASMFLLYCGSYFTSATVTFHDVITSIYHNFANKFQSSLPWDSPNIGSQTCSVYNTEPSVDIVYNNLVFEGYTRGCIDLP